MTYNLADLFERVVDAGPERTALVDATSRWSYVELDDRATQLAHALSARGVRRGDHVGIQLRNRSEYIEAMLGAFKISAVPVNVDYRYTDRELAYLYSDASLVALIYGDEFAPQVCTALERSPTVRSVIAVGSPHDSRSAIADCTGYEQAIAAEGHTRDFKSRSGDDLYLAYTGGTTGLPKGVMWRHEDIFFAAMGGGDPTTMQGPISAPAEIVDRILPTGTVMLVLPPLIHVSAHWAAFSILFGGGTVVLTSGQGLDADEAWRMVEQEHVNILSVVGDAMARPLLDAVAQHPDRYDRSSLFVFASGGAVLSSSTKAQIAALLPNVIAIDGFGSTETGVSGKRSQMPGAPVETHSMFNVGADLAVLDDELNAVRPGSGVIGQLARRGHMPIGYYKDPVKTAATFVELKSERWALTGDAATVEADGSVVLLGRGSASINTGGEKVYPEEVEAVVKDHPGVFDAVIVGASHERWGEQVVAVVALRENCSVTLEDVRSHCRAVLASYKLPRELFIVDRIVRTTAGKVDYQWARDLVASRR